MDDTQGTRSRGRSAPAPAETPDRGAFLRSLHLLSSAVNRVLEDGLLDRAGWTPLTANQLHLLRLICGGGRWTVGRVASVLGVSSPAASKILARLEGSGLVRRHGSVEDRRQVYVRATSEGRRAVREINALQAKTLDTALLELGSDRKAEQVRTGIEQLAVAILLAGPRREDACLVCGGHPVENCDIRAGTGWCPYLGEQPEPHEGDGEPLAEGDGST